MTLARPATNYKHVVSWSVWRPYIWDPWPKDVISSWWWRLHPMHLGALESHPYFWPHFWVATSALFHHFSIGEAISQEKKSSNKSTRKPIILLMEEILHQLIWYIFHYVLEIAGVCLGFLQSTVPHVCISDSYVQCLCCKQAPNGQQHDASLICHKFGVETSLSHHQCWANKRIHHLKTCHHSTHWLRTQGSTTSSSSASPRSR